MPATRKQIARDKIAEAKHLYERTLVPVADIAALLGISGRTFSNCVGEWVRLVFFHSRSSEPSSSAAGDGMANK